MARAKSVLPAPGLPTIRHVMSASRGDFERAFDVFLSFDFGEVCGGEERFERLAGGLIRLNEMPTR
jgi:hypothetical protein